MADLHKKQKFLEVCSSEDENEVALKTCRGFGNHNAQCSEDEFDPLGKYKRQAEKKAVYVDIVSNSSTSDDSDFCLDSKAKHNSRRTNECGQTRKTAVAIEIDNKTERVRTTPQADDTKLDLIPKGTTPAVGMLFSKFQLCDTYLRSFGCTEQLASIIIGTGPQKNRGKNHDKYRRV